MNETPDILAPTPEQLVKGARAFWQSVQAQQSALQALSARDLVERMNALLELAVPGVAAEVATDAVQGSAAAAGAADSVRQLVFTSHGSIAHFAAVQAVVAQAPQGLPWEVQAFRQRVSQGFGMRMDKFELPSSDLLVRVGQFQGRVALGLSFAKPVPKELQEHPQQMAFILLDHMLGEFDLAVKVGLVEFEEDGLSEGTGADAAQPVPLDQAVAVVDALWLDTLGRTGQYPQGAHDWVSIKGRSVQGAEIQTQVNRSANALVGRADMGWRVDASVAVGTASTQAAARAFEKAWVDTLAVQQQGIASHVVQRDGWRHVCCYVTDSPLAVQAALTVAQRCLIEAQPLELTVTHEPGWDDYLVWLGRC
jgi:hypothetical protein